MGVIVYTVVAACLLLGCAKAEPGDTEFTERDPDFIIKDVIQEATKTHTHTVVFMHGWTQGEKAGLSFVEGLQRITKSKQLKHNTRFVLVLGEKLQYPDVTFRGWANVPEVFSKDVLEDEAGFRKSQKRVAEYIRAEHDAHKIPYSNIAVGGFSQGGALAYLTGLEFKDRLMGIFAISSWVPLMQNPSNPSSMKLNKPINLEAIKDTKTPILHCHSTDDPTVPYLMAEMSVGFVRMGGLESDYQFKTFPGGHVVTEDAVRYVAEFLDNQMQPVTESDVAKRSPGTSRRSMRRGPQQPMTPPNSVPSLGLNGGQARSGLHAPNTMFSYGVSAGVV